MSTGLSTYTSLYGSLTETDDSNPSLFALIREKYYYYYHSKSYEPYKLWTWTACAIDVIGINCNNFAQQQLCALHGAVLGILITYITVEENMYHHHHHPGHPAPPLITTHYHPLPVVHIWYYANALARVQPVSGQKHNYDVLLQSCVYITISYYTAYYILLLLLLLLLKCLRSGIIMRQTRKRRRRLPQSYCYTIHILLLW